MHLETFLNWFSISLLEFVELLYVIFTHLYKSCQALVHAQSFFVTLTATQGASTTPNGISGKTILWILLLSHMSGTPGGAVAHGRGLYWLARWALTVLGLGSPLALSCIGILDTVLLYSENSFARQQLISEVWKTAQQTQKVKLGVFSGGGHVYLCRGFKLRPTPPPWFCSSSFHHFRS